MIKINWQRLGKSIFACFVGAWLGLIPIVVEEELRHEAYVLDNTANILPWLMGGLRLAIHIPLSYMPLLAFIPMVLIGLPLQAILQRFGKVSYLWTVIPAIPCGPLVLGLIFVIYADVLRGSLDPFALVLTAAGAFTTTSIFWLVRRPDRDSANGQDSAKQAKDV